jgi:hypothetical protein
MVQMLIVGLVWLALTAVLCLVIGRALRTGDQSEEQHARETLMALPPADLFARSSGGAAEAGFFAPEPGRPLVDDEELDRWGELWRWEDELRRGVDLWCGEADPDGRPRQDPDAAD